MSLNTKIIGENNHGVEINDELIKRYNKNGPRYTSYPTAASFEDSVDTQLYLQHVLMSNELPVPPDISLYVHIPFCDTLCFYCGCNKIATKNRDRGDVYLDYVEKEAKLLKPYFDPDRLVTQLHWGGGTPTFLTQEQMSRLMTILSDNWNFSPTDERDFSIEIDPRSTTAEGIKDLYKLGFNRFSLGVQDVDADVQKAINRIQPLAMTKSILDACREVGAKSINIDLIYGLPLQTVETFSDTLDAIIELSPDRLSVFNYAHLPQMFSPQKRIKEEELPSSNTKLEMFHMIVEKLISAGYVYIGLDHFAKPNDELALALDNGTLQRNFQGYTTHADSDLISLGVSSISSLDGLMVQNEKDINTYYERLDNSDLPIARGVLLTEDDKIRRYIIQQLMCQNKVDLNDALSSYQLKGWSYFSREFELLKPMEEDGLVVVDASSVTITLKGRMLARNIAMVFDTRSQQKIAEQKFSKVI